LRPRVACRKSTPQRGPRTPSSSRRRSQHRRKWQVGRPRSPGRASPARIFVRSVWTSVVWWWGWPRAVMVRGCGRGCGHGYGRCHRGLRDGLGRRRGRRWIVNIDGLVRRRDRWKERPSFDCRNSGLAARVDHHRLHLNQDGGAEQGDEPGHGSCTQREPGEQPDPIPIGSLVLRSSSGAPPNRKFANDHLHLLSPRCELPVDLECTPERRKSDSPHRLNGTSGGNLPRHRPRSRLVGFWRPTERSMLRNAEPHESRKAAVHPEPDPSSRAWATEHGLRGW